MIFQKPFSILLFFVGIGLILYGLYSELGSVSLSGWLPGGRLGAVFTYVGVLVIMWGGLALLEKTVGKHAEGSDSAFAKLGGGVLYTVLIFGTLILIGAIIFEVAQYSKENQIDNPRVSTASGSTSRTSNSSSSSSKNSQPVSNAVTSFYVMFERDDTGNKRRDFSRSGDVWTERVANGQTHEFRLVGRSSVGNCPGIIARKQDGSEIFIPDKGCNDMTLWYRYQTRDWGFFGQMLNVR
jgi:hypothetical protein